MLFVDDFKVFKTTDLKCPPKPPERKAKIKRSAQRRVKTKGGSLVTIGEGFYNGVVDLAVMDGY